MGNAKKKLSFLLITILAISSPMMVKLSSAQSIPKPSVPEFSIETVSSPYDVPPTTTSSTNPYTNQTTTTTIPGYHVENKTTEIKIKNQPFTPYQIQENGDNWTINLFYNIHIKGNFSQDWGYYKLYNGSGDGNLVQDYKAQYTIVPIDEYLPIQGQVDIQIQALEGYQHGVNTVPGVPGEQWIVTGSASDWSSTQTLTVGELTSPSPTPTIPEFPLLIIIAIVLVAVLFFNLLLKRKEKEGSYSFDLKLFLYF